ncbi:MAG: hypothetical protein MK102_04535 [Fuerstiella sp.]|nr:hypothetical protein [Fuerstiella sp.]
MKKIVGICVLSMLMLVASTAAAAEFKSGLQVGDSPGAFYVSDVTGPNAGKNLCYKCQYGFRPVVSIFTRTMDDDVKRLIKQIDEVVGRNYEKYRMAAFVVLLSDQPRDHQASLVATAKEMKLSYTPLTTFRKSVGPRRYYIHEDSDVTVMMWVDNDVMSNHAFAKGKLSEEAIRQVVADTSKILN